MVQFEQVNSKCVRARLSVGGSVVARRGAMLAYTGRVRFSPVAGTGAGGLRGVAGMAARAVAGEAVHMMIAEGEGEGEGEGEVFYGFLGHHVTVVELGGTGPLSVEADRLLAHDGSLQTAVVFLGSQGGIRGAVRGAVTGQGLFTTQLSGTGPVALLSHGGTVPLTVDQTRSVAVDPQAYVGHVGDLRVDISASIGWREAVGRGSGEAIQLQVSGRGTVYVQASERKFS